MQFKKYRIMKKSLYAAILATVIFSSCANEFNRVYKTSDNTYKYEYAKESYTNGKYVRASTLLQGLVTMQKGTENAQESLYMLGMAEYNSKEEKTFEDILGFHVRFERIHPFQDGNGRIGRLIMFKECLKHNIVPFIITDELKLFYYRGLREWKNERGFLRDTCLTAQDFMKETLGNLGIEY